MIYPTRLLPLLALLAAACGPNKGDTTDADTGNATTQTTGPAPTTTTPTGCDLPPPSDEECTCAPGCGEFQCVDDAWSCECVSCGGTPAETDPATTEPEPTTTTGAVPCSDPAPPFDECLCAPSCGEWVCVGESWSCECFECGVTTFETDPGPSTGEPETTGGPAVDCTADPQVFPPLHNGACASDDECTVVLHQVDCCGTDEAWGIAVADQAAFAEAEAACETQFPLCDCAPMPTKADDGQVGEQLGDFAAVCVANACQSIVP